LAEASASKPAARRAGYVTAGLPEGSSGRTKIGQRVDEATVSTARFDAVMQAARQSGLLGEKASRIGGRVSPALVEQAKRQTGIRTDTDLIEFALATIALDDQFAAAFKEARGTVDPELKLGF
jgi:hypothetical protein